MTISVNQIECFIGRKNEASCGKATFFLGYEPQNFNFVRFGEQLDKILSQFQWIGSGNIKLNNRNNTLMNSILQIPELNQLNIYKDYSFFIGLKELSVLAAFSGFSQFIKKIHNKEV